MTREGKQFGAIKKVDPKDLKAPESGQKFDLKKIAELGHSIAVIEANKLRESGA